MAALFLQHVDISSLEERLILVKQKYLHHFIELEKTYPVKWHVEKNDTNISKPYEAMACSTLKNKELRIYFLLHHIEAELNQKYKITNLDFLMKVSSIFLEFLLLHELRHLNQFCEGLTIEEYNASGKYKDNPYEKDANEFALNLIQAESEK